MPDRRQGDRRKGDRRETKQGITIDSKTIIIGVIVIALIIIGIVVFAVLNKNSHSADLDNENEYYLDDDEYDDEIYEEYDDEIYSDENEGNNSISEDAIFDEEDSSNEG